MNTADRSLVQLDSALRRRFDFLEIMPRRRMFKDLKVGNIEIGKLFNAMNDRISFLLDRDHQIGHSYFMPLIENPTLENLMSIFKNRIIPLLQEYFYDDYQNIKLVLNDDNGFISETIDSSYLYNLKDSTEGRNYLIRTPKTEDPYIRIYTDVNSLPENE